MKYRYLEQRTCSGGIFTTQIHSFDVNHIIIDFDKHTFHFTTGVLLPGEKLGYLKETLPLKAYYHFPDVMRVSTPYKQHVNNDRVKFVCRLKRAFRSIFPRRLSEAGPNKSSTQNYKSQIS